MWEYYESIVETACHGGAEVIDKDKLDAATYLLAHALMTNSFRRPGAVIIITIKEFEQAKKETSTGQEEMANKIVDNKVYNKTSGSNYITI